MKIITRYRTSQEVDQLLDFLINSIKLSSKAAIMRIGIGLSLTDNSIPEDYINLDKKGFEIHKHVLFGENEELFEALIKCHYFNMNDIDNEHFNEIFFPDLVGAHIERGVRMLHSEYKFAGNTDNLMKLLLDKLM